jgi:hypothetical protein
VANTSALGSTPSFAIQIRATDNGTPAASAVGTVTINVQSVNRPPVINDQSFTINENSAVNTTVGGLVWSDPDPLTVNPTFTIVSGNELGGFRIDAVTGRLSVANSAPLNFEATPIFRLNVRLNDNGSPNLSDTAVITINLANVNEAPVVNDQTFRVRTGSAAGTTVGTVVATDPDVGQTKTFSITGGNTGTTFRIDAATGRITVASAAGVRTARTYRLTVTVRDNGTPQLSDTAVITINVSNSTAATASTTTTTTSTTIAQRTDLLRTGSTEDEKFI